MATVPTFADRALPVQHRTIKNLLLIAGGSALCAIASQIALPLPFTPVPVNGLTFAVLLLGAMLGWRRGSAAVVLFLIEGILGLPVFAQHRLGLATLLGPSGGYLAGAPLAAALVGALSQRRWDRHVFQLCVALLLGDAVIFGAGVSWLARFPLPVDVWHAGLLPYLPGETLKILLVVLLLPTAWRWIGEPTIEQGV